MDSTEKIKDKQVIYQTSQNIDFNKKPVEAIEYWRKVLSDDIKAGKRIKEYRLFNYFQKCPQKYRDYIANHILKNYQLSLECPPGKISLAIYKDDLGRITSNYSPRHLIILIYSIIGKGTTKKSIPATKEYKGDGVNYPAAEPRGTQRRGLLEQAFGNSSKYMGMITNKGNIITIDKKWDDKITLILDESVKIQKDDPRLLQMYDLVVDLNKIIPSKKVKEINISQKMHASSYQHFEHTITILLDEYYLEATAHEMGHAIYDVLLENKMKELLNVLLDKKQTMDSKDSVWQNIYYLSLANKNYEIIDDSNYEKGSKDMTGHPYDDPSELFASSVMVYRLHPDEFIRNIINDDTSKETNKVGKLIFSYLRDKIFKGKIYSKEGSFKPELLEVGDEEVSVSLIKAFGDSNPDVCKAAANAIGELGMKDERFIGPLIKALGDSYYIVRRAATNAIGELGIKDERFIIPLIIALGDSHPNVRDSAARAIGQLGMKDKRFIGPLIKALGDSYYYVCETASQAIVYLQDTRFVMPLIKGLNLETLLLMAQKYIKQLLFET